MFFSYPKVLKSANNHIFDRPFLRNHRSFAAQVLFKLTYQCCCQEQIEEEVFDFTEFVNAACATKATVEAAGETFVCHGACGNFDTLSMAIWTLVHVCLTGESAGRLTNWPVVGLGTNFHIID